ncbi:MAG TPA: SCO family protein [Gemmataceae bacterium]|nr:SCO family protein [Gemmataceae bacterium]
MKSLFASIILCISLHAAHASLSPAELAKVILAPPANAAVPSGLVFHDLNGHAVTISQSMNGAPALLLLVDFTCHTICRPALAIASGALGETGLRAGSDFKFIVVGLDPKDSVTDAKAMLGQIGNPEVARTTTVLRGDGAAIQALTRAVGYKYIYDADVDQFAHPAGILVLTADGHVSRSLSSLALNPGDLHLALLEAGRGHTGSLTDRLALFCYGFDAAHGVYTLLIWRLLEIAAGLTVFALVAFIFLLERRHRAGPLKTGP